MIPKAPKVKRPKRAKQSKLMKGRPITVEEFERMLDKAITVRPDPQMHHEQFDVMAM